MLAVCLGRRQNTQHNDWLAWIKPCQPFYAYGQENKLA
jgi:hypothetical protein